MHRASVNEGPPDAGREGRLLQWVLEAVEAAAPRARDGPADAVWVNGPIGGAVEEDRGRLAGPRENRERRRRAAYARRQAERTNQSVRQSSGRLHGTRPIALESDQSLAQTQSRSRPAETMSSPPGVSAA